MPYLPHKTCCPDPVASAAAIPDEANCSWLHQSNHCEVVVMTTHGAIGDDNAVKSTIPYLQ